MKTTTPELLALMQGNQTFTLADLYTITTAAGTALRYTDFDVDLETPSNMLTYSEQFDTSYAWNVRARCAVVADSAMSPWGIEEADLVYHNESTDRDWYIAQNGSLVAGKTYCSSVYFKPSSGCLSAMSVYLHNTFFGENKVVSWDRSADAAVIMGGSGIVGYGLEKLPGGWRRLWISAVATVTATYYYAALFWAMSNYVIGTYIGNHYDPIGEGYYLFGGQLHEGAAPLRYVKTESSPVAGNTFSASGPILKRGKTRIVIGLEVDTLDVDIYPRPDDLVSGQTWLAAATAGVFDGATLKLERAFLSPTPTVAGALVMFSGVFADLETARARISARVNSDTAALQVQVPRNLYQASCLNVLYGADCRADRATYAAAGTVSGGSNTASILCSLAQAAGYFDTGYVVFTSGALAGTRRTVKAYVPGKFTLYNPLPSAPAVGAAFTVYPGCDKSLVTCKDKFNNRANFRGFPFIPVPETSI